MYEYSSNQKNQNFDYNYISNYHDGLNEINQSQSVENNLVSSSRQEESIEGNEMLQQGQQDQSSQSQSSDEKFMKKFKKVIKKMKKIKDETKSLKKDLKEQKEKNKILVEKMQSGSEDKQKSDKIKNSEKNQKILLNPKSSNNDQVSNSKFILDWIKKFSNQGLLTINNYLDIKFDEKSNKDNSLKISTKNIINKNTNLIKIDKKLILTTKSSIAEKICNKVKKIPEFFHNYDKICLSVILLLSQESENQNDTNTKPHSYLNKNYILSKSYDHFPIFYKDKTLKVAKGTLFNSLIQARRDLFDKEYSILSENKIIKKSDIELKEYFKARSYVISRNFMLKNKEGSSAIIPLLDQVKIIHKNEKNQKNEKNEKNLKNLKNQKFEKNEKISNCNFNFETSNTAMYMYLNTTRKIEKDEELILQSGAMSNENLLLYYGYTMENNKMKSDFFIDIKINSKLNSTSSIDYESIPLRHDYDLNKTLINFRKLISGKNDIIKDFETESQAVNILKKSLKAQLDKYPSNYKSDEIILKNQKNLTENEINLYRVIIEEKRRVNAYYNFVSFFNKIFKLVGSNKIISEKLLRKISVTKAYRKYYNSVKDVFIKKKNINVVDKGGNDINNIDIDGKINNNLSENLKNGNFTNFSNFSKNETIIPSIKNNSTLIENKQLLQGNFTSSIKKPSNLPNSDEEEEDDVEVEDELESEDDT
jgi:hypothetical protein